MTLTIPCGGVAICGESAKAPAAAGSGLTEVFRDCPKMFAYISISQHFFPPDP